MVNYYHQKYLETKTRVDVLVYIGVRSIQDEVDFKILLYFVVIF